MSNLPLLSGFNKLNIFSGDKPEEGFYWVHDYKSQLNPYIRIALEAANKYEAKAVYFRLFQEGNPPIPQIYIFDFTSNPFDRDTFSEVHKKIWNSIQVPLIYAFLPTEILIFNSYSPEFKNNSKLSFFEKIKLASDLDNILKQKNVELIKDFSVGNFASGAFWENEKYSKDFVVSKGVYETLISKLNEIRKKLIQTENIFSISISDDEKVDFIHRLLVMSILLKYLEERTDKEGNTVFEKGYFAKYHHNARCFVDVLENNGNILELFKDLSAHFNGEVFELNKREAELISKLDLRKFAEFFEGKTEPGIQRTIWRLYSFDDLPIELISNIYEQFLKKEATEEEEAKDLKEQKNQAGIFYTPPFLANFLLDRVIPLTESDKITDIRILDPSCGSGIFLVQAYKRLIYRWKQNNNWKRPSQEDLKDLLTNCIFGIDIKKDAIRLTAFSLVLALCNELTPLEIWQELKFDRLKDNLFSEDFFKVIDEKRISIKFDLVIGNPPFLKKLTPFAERIEKKRNESGLIPLPENYKLSYFFLEQTLKLINNTGAICLLFPADSLLHRKCAFTDSFLSEINIPLIIDFTPLRRTIFKSATVATVAIFYNLQEKEDNITHIVARRTKSARNELFFELDKYDVHIVPVKEALQNKFIWKSNLLGTGNRNYDLLKKLNLYPKFLSYLVRMKKQNLLSKNNTHFPYLAIKKNIGGLLFNSKIFDEQTEIDNNFKSEVFKIYSSSKKTANLNEIKKTFDENKNIYKFFALNTSDRAALSRSSSTILGHDIEQLPFTSMTISESLTDIENILILDCVNYAEEFIRLGENSKSLKKASPDELIDFGNCYLKVINSVYKTYKFNSPICTENHVIFPFYWGEPEIPANLSELKDRIDSLLKIEMPSASLKFIRILRLYDDNVIYLIKPNQIRYWLRSVAIRDADETFAYLVKREYANSPK